jgi:pyridoxine 4-dehydrogenase
VQLSLLSRDPIRSGDVLDVARELNVGVIGYSPLCLGLLTGKYRLSGPLPQQLSRRLLFQRLLRGSKELFNELETVASETGLSMPQVAIAWCLSKGVFVISGVRTVAQATELMNRELTISSSQVRRLEAAAARANPQMLRNVFQTD